MKKLWIIFLFIVVSLSAQAQMKNPYIDDKLFHFGFSLGVNLMAYGVTDSELPIDGLTYHARTSNMLPGFSVGFITDLRLARHLNLRFLPTLSFGQRTITYKAYKQINNEWFEQPVPGSSGNQAEVLSLPLALPFVLKWSAEREMNYRPYIIAGGGVGFDFAGQKERPIYQQTFDYFVTFGFGCDVYLEWFKFCPELRYQIGFNNAITPVDQRPELPTTDYFYTNALKRLRNQMITLTFNFE